MEGIRCQEIRASEIAGAVAEQYVFLRSAFRDYGYRVVYVYASGSVNNANAQNANRCAPARAI